MTLSRANASYTDGVTEITASNMNTINHNLTNGWDGIGGGEYYLQAALNFSGSVVEFGTSKELHAYRLSVGSNYTVSTGGIYTSLYHSATEGIVFLSNASLDYRYELLTVPGSLSTIIDGSMDAYIITDTFAGTYTLRLVDATDAGVIGGRVPTVGQTITITKKNNSNSQVVDAYRGTSNTSRVFQLTLSNCWVKCVYTATGWLAYAWGPTNSHVTNIDY